MTDELKPVRCGCGGEAIIGLKEWEDRKGNYHENSFVYCDNCSISTGGYLTEAEAITAWNRAMGATDTNVGNKTAKVVTEEKPIEGSDNYIAVTCCDKCGNVVSLFDTYCSGCGCRLEWK